MQGKHPSVTRRLVPSGNISFVIVMKGLNIILSNIICDGPVIYYNGLIDKALM